MSLESYRKSLEEQRQREEASTEHNEKVKTEYVYVERTSSNKGFGRLILWLVIIAFFVVAAIKNPPADETKAMVKTALVEMFNKRMGSVMSNEESSAKQFFGALLGMSLAPNLIDNFTETTVSDYIILSTFNCTAEVEDETKTLVSGVVIFGKIIPLKSDLDKYTFEVNK